MRKLSGGQIAGIVIGVVLFAFLVVCVGVSFYPFKLSDAEVLSLYQLMKDVDEILTLNGVSYVVESGTLLGCIRHRGLIPWDDDLDIQVLQQDEDAFLALRPKFNSIGFDIRPAKFGYKIQPNVKKHSAFPFCDVFITAFDENKFSKNKNNSFAKCRFHESEYFPTKRYTFGDIEVNGPANPTLFLDRCYGKSWPEISYRFNPDKFLYFSTPVPKQLAPEDRKPAMPTGPLNTIHV